MKRFSLEEEQGKVTASPQKLFTACLQYIITNAMDWSKKGINIDGEYLSYLIFADDIVLLAHHPKEIEEMLTSLNEASKPIDLKTHVGKTKVMLNPLSVKGPIRIFKTF